MIDGSRTPTDVALDHIVHVVHSPDEVRNAFEQEFGFHSVPGGEHTSWGTFNALSYFGLSYIEWLGVRDAVRAASSAFGRLAQLRLRFGEGGSLFAVRTSQMDKMADAWRDRGLSFIGPVDASRNRPDGTTLRWRMLFPRNFDGSEIRRGEAMLPFVIEWDSDDAARILDLEKTGALLARQQYEMAGIHVVTRDVGAWVNGWNNYFSLAGPPREPVPLTGSGTFCTQVGGTTLYVEPLQDFAGASGGRAYFPGVERLDLARTDEARQYVTPVPRVIAGLSVHVVG